MDNISYYLYRFCNSLFDCFSSGAESWYFGDSGKMNHRLADEKTKPNDDSEQSNIIVHKKI